MVANFSYRYEDDYFNDSIVQLKEVLFLPEDIRNQLMIENNDFFVEGLDNDSFAKFTFKPVFKRKDERLDKHSPKLLPVELFDNYQIMQKASEENPLKILETDAEQLAYIKKMENVWNRSTQEHIQYMQSKDLEGNVDDRTWYRIALQLNERGLLDDLEV